MEKNKKFWWVWLLFIFLFLDALAIIGLLGLGVYLFIQEAPKEEINANTNAEVNVNTNEAVYEEINKEEEEEKEWRVDKDYFEINKYDLVESLEFGNYGLGDAKNIQIWVALVPTIDNYQHVLSREISPTDYELIKDEEGNEFALFTVDYMRTMDGNYQPEEMENIKITYEIELALYMDDLSQCVGEKPNAYLDPEVYIESDDLEIMKLARNLSEGAKTDCDKAEIFYNHVADNMAYEYNITYGGALNAMHTELGDCTGYSDYFIALSRASGMPARFFTGLVYAGDGTDYTQMLHNWAEVYLPGIGWTQVDPTIGQPEYSRPYYFAATSGDQVIITRGRQPSLLGKDDYFYFYFTYEDAGNDVSAVDATQSWQFIPVLTDQ